MNKEMLQKILKVTSTVIFVLLAVIMIIMMSAVLHARLINETPRLFGYSFHVVVTDSMTPEIKPKDAVIVKRVTISEVEVGDNVLYIMQDKTSAIYGRQVIHKVIEITEDGKLITSGIKEGATPDKLPVTDIEGVFVSKSTFAGHIIVFLQSPLNLFFITLIIVLLIVIFTVTKRIIKIYKEKDKDKETSVEAEESKNE